MKGIRDSTTSMTSPSGHGFDEKDNEELRCFAYIMTDGRDVGLPTPYYMETCIQGYRDFGFDTRILKRTVERMRKILWKRKNLK